MTLYSIYETHDRVAELRKLRGIGDWLVYMDLSHAQACVLIPEPSAIHARHISRGQVNNFVQGRREIDPRQVRAIEDHTSKVLGDELRRDFHRPESREYRVEITVGVRRWMVKAWVQCVKCGRFYNATREQTRRCRRCISRSKRQLGR